MKNNQLKLILPAIFLMIMVGIHAQNVLCLMHKAH